MTDQRDGSSSCAEKICAEKSARYRRLDQSSGSTAEQTRVVARCRRGIVCDAIPTKRNSLVISIAQKAAKCRNGSWRHYENPETSNLNTAFVTKTGGRAFSVHYISNPKRSGASFEEGSRQRCVSDITPPVEGARALDSRTAQENSISITSPARASSVGGTSNASGGREALRPITMDTTRFGVALTCCARRARSRCGPCTRTNLPLSPRSRHR
jgi:hypothetical protein